MKEIFVLLVLAIAIFIYYLKQSEKFTSLPPISRAVPWGSTPNKLYGDEPSHGINTMGSEVSEIMEDADYTGFSYGRALGFGIGEINKRLNKGIHSTKQNVYYV